MNARLHAMWMHLAGLLVGLPPARRLTVAAAGVASTALVLGLAWWLQRPPYRPLFASLSAEDAGAIVQALGSENVPFRLDDGGRAVLVPAGRVHELRVALASRGLPERGGVGLERLERPRSGITDFVQRLDRRRALQAELARTIDRLAGVESARVTLALPERSPSVDEHRRPSASVIVKLATGRALARSEIDGIVHLIASSVEGLDADAVTVVDERGRLLTADRDRAERAAASTSALEMQSAVERQIADRIETMLTAVVGRDKAIARVAATLDFTRVERTEETYDPDRSVLKTEHSTREQTTGPDTTVGTRGGQPNPTIAAAGAASGRDAPRSERRDEQQTYEVSKVVSRTVAPVGALKQLSVAVLIDGVYSEEKGERVFSPRPPEEMERLRELVKGAVGFSEARGDKIEVACVPFRTEPAPPGEGVVGVLARSAPAVLVRLLAAAFAAVMLVHVVRPLVLSLATRPATAALVPPVVAVAGVEEAAKLTRENLALTRQNPERTAQLVREWLQGGTAADGPGD